jgi:hypothetical protein
MFGPAVVASSQYRSANAENVVPLRHNLLRVPACAQCRAAMTVERFDPLLNGGSFLATFHCVQCGLKDRFKI